MARLFSGREVVDDWSPLDGVPAPDYVPLQWTGPHVARRLIDAWVILARMPWRSPYPRTFGHTWPSYKLEWHDLLALSAVASWKRHNASRTARASCRPPRKFLKWNGRSSGRWPICVSRSPC